MLRHPLVIIEAPSNLGLKPPAPDKEPGVSRMPDALRRAGLATNLAIQHVERVAAPPYQPAIDPQTGIRNAQAIHDYSMRLADAVQAALHRQTFPLVIGGDCSILLGSMLAHRRIGQYGLCFIDGHSDFQTPQTSQTGGAAGMDLALATGHGPPLLTNLEGLGPLIDESRVVVLGNRDTVDGAPAVNDAISRSEIEVCPLDKLRQRGIAEMAGAVLNRFPESAVQGIWVHVDVDVLDSTLFPAVDSPQPGGLHYDELELLLQHLIGSSRVVGMQFTIFDPDLDPNGQYAARLHDVIVASLR